MSHSVSSLRFAALALVAAAQAACSSSTASSPSGGLDAADKGDVGGGTEMTGGAAGAAGTDAGRAPNAGGTDARGGATGSGTGGGAAAGSGGSGGTGGSNQPDGGADARDGAVTFIDGPRRDTAPNPGAKVPAQFLDLSNWKITLPIGNAEEIKQPQLATYQMPPIFWMDPDGGYVVFRAIAGGGTTSGSSYPRSELREMMDAGKTNASWSTSSGKHTMIITQAIKHTLVKKPHVVAGQIHDASDDLVMVRLEGPRLFVESRGVESGDLDPGYKLGTKFTVKVEAALGRVKIFYNDMTTPKVDLLRPATGCYFKAGVYTQSNPDKGEAASAFGEVHMYDLKVTHE